jgi:CHAT domain/SIR2-like domain
MKKYEDFEIVVEKITGVDIYAVNVRQACGGKKGDASSSFSLGEINNASGVPGENGDNNSQPPSRHIILSGGQEKKLTLLRTGSLSKELATKVGVRLSQALFRNEILELWGDCKGYSKSVSAAVRIRLDLTRAPELAALPWEYLRLPDNTNFVGLDMDATMVRYLRTSDAVRPLKVIPPLRILVMASMPQDLPQLEINNEIVKIKEALVALPEQTVEVVVLPQATGESLKNALKQAQKDDRPFHIFHYIGHGAFDETKQEGVLLFEDEQRKSVAVGHDDLGRWLQPYCSDLRLMVLNACEGARLSISDIYSSVAAKVMQIAEIPAVIAMQFTVTDTAAITFAQAFYEKLAEGENLEGAVDAARLAVNKPNSAKEEWATPVFYLRANNGHLFDVKIPKPPESLIGHYSAVKAAIPRCSLVFFLGLNVNLLNRPYYDSWKPGRGLPSTAELCAYLSTQNKIVPTSNSLASLAQLLRLRGKVLPDEFTPIFETSAKASKLYEVLGKLTQKITEQLPDEALDPCHCSMLFVTTTYDFALERAFADAGIAEYNSVCYGQGGEGRWFFTHRQYKEGKLVANIPLIVPNTPNEYKGLRNKAPVILKLPGEVTLDSNFAITEDDFFTFANEELSELLPADLIGQIKSSRHLYIGYDLQNWTLRLLQSRICANQDKAKKDASYAVVFDENEDPNAAFWREINVKFATAHLEDYVAGLEEYVLNEL